MQENVLTSMHSARLEPTKLVLVRVGTRTTYEKPPRKSTQLIAGTANRYEATRKDRVCCGPCVGCQYGRSGASYHTPVKMDSIEPCHGRVAPDVPELLTFGAQYLTRYNVWEKFVWATRPALLCASPKTKMRVKCLS